jgi:plasmid maintenance system antidote protein VapI
VRTGEPHNAIIPGERGITAETALRLARFFWTTDCFWMNLQSNCDLAVARERDAPLIEREVVRYTRPRPIRKKKARANLRDNASQLANTKSFETLRATYRSRWGVSDAVKLARDELLAEVSKGSSR